VAYEQIACERRDDILVITLDRPEKLNAWTPVMNAELIDAIEAADADATVGAIVVTGAGRGFCAGADMSAVFETQIRGDDDGVPRARRDWVELLRSCKPIVAAVNGPCIGVGLTMILPFDRIVVAESAKLSIRFVKLGLVPELASTTYLPRRCGWGVASDLMISGRTIDGAEALALGVADELATDEEVVETAVTRAHSYAENPPQAVKWIKQLLTDNAVESDTSAAQRRELELLRQGYQTQEHRDAVAAFLTRADDRPDRSP
jgi:enoyl-CoA hydratase/carnithine racemase